MNLRAVKEKRANACWIAEDGSDTLAAIFRGGNVVF